MQQRTTRHSAAAADRASRRNSGRTAADSQRNGEWPAPEQSRVNRSLPEEHNDVHIEEILCSERPPEAALGIDSTEPQLATTPLLDPSLTFRLHSDPYATKTIYLDFNGHTTTGTAWNTSTMGSSFTSPAYDFDYNPASFSTAELSRIQQIWQRVASDFAPFDVNVTTQAPPLDWLIRSSSTDPNYGIRVVITSYGPFSSTAGGVSYVNSFRANTDTPCFVYGRAVIGAAEAISHEVGHTLGLSHDGKGTSSYYTGHGSGETSWAPIMGSSYNRYVTTWDIGQYNGSNNGSSTANYSKGPDDLAVITQNNGFGYQPDLVGNTSTTAANLRINGSQVNQFGTIETRQDVDCYAFELISSGDLNLSVDPYWIRSYVDADGNWGGSSSAVALRVSDMYSSTSFVENGSNLDLLVNLYDANGKLIANANPPGLAASLSLTGLAPGRYVLSLDGVGFGDPMAATASGYTDASSLGFYRISGMITGAAENQLALATASSTDLLATSTATSDPITGRPNRKAATMADAETINAPSLTAGFDGEQQPLVVIPLDRQPVVDPGSTLGLERIGGLQTVGDQDWTNPNLGTDWTVLTGHGPFGNLLS